MKVTISYIIAKASAAQRFPTLALLVGARQCHKMCGYVAFRDIIDIRDRVGSWSVNLVPAVQRVPILALAL